MKRGAFASITLIYTCTYITYIHLQFLFLLFIPAFKCIQSKFNYQIIKVIVVKIQNYHKFCFAIVTYPNKISILRLSIYLSIIISRNKILDMAEIIVILVKDVNGQFPYLNTYSLALQLVKI